MIVTPIRADTTALVETGDSLIRRNSFVVRQPTKVAAAPKVALVAIAHPSRPGVMNWIVCSDSSSTRCPWYEYVGGLPEAATFEAWMNDINVPCATADCTW